LRHFHTGADTVYWVERERVGRNPLTGESTVVRRRALHTNEALPWKEGYDLAIGALLDGRPFPPLADGDIHDGA
jgi:hypothetical protein